MGGFYSLPGTNSRTKPFREFGSVGEKLGNEPFKVVRQCRPQSPILFALPVEGPTADALHRVELFEVAHDVLRIVEYFGLVVGVIVPRLATEVYGDDVLTCAGSEERQFVPAFDALVRRILPVAFGEKFSLDDQGGTARTG